MQAVLAVGWGLTLALSDANAAVLAAFQECGRGVSLVTLSLLIHLCLYIQSVFLGHNKMERHQWKGGKYLQTRYLIRG